MKKRVARKVIKYGMLSNRGRLSTYLRAIRRDPEFHFWTRWTNILTTFSNKEFRG